MITEVKIPFHDVNDDSVVLVEWYVKPGDGVKTEDSICALETAKTVYDLQADRDGFILSLRYAEGDRIPVRETICFIADSLDESILAVQEVNGTPPSLPKDDTAFNATDKARKLAKELGVDLSLLKMEGIIREKDVRNHFHEANASAVPLGSGMPRVAINPVLPSMLEEIQKDGNFRERSSEEKIRFYVQNGAEIGKRVSIGHGSIILAGAIRIGDDVTIGSDCHIEVDELSLGCMVNIGNHCHMTVGRLDIGEVTILADRVFVDVSGGKSGESGVVIGKQSLICNEVYLNASHMIHIGNKVALSPRAMVYTHGYWQSVLDGYHASFNGVRIDDNSWIGSATQVLPGVHVGEGSIAMSNSLVSSHVASFTMVGGVPAVPIKKQLKKDLTLAAKEKIMESLLQEFAASLRLRGYMVNVEMVGGATRYVVTSNKIGAEFVLEYTVSAHVSMSRKKDRVYIGFRFPRNEEEHGIIFDLGEMEVRGGTNRLSEELRNFLRRRGITFSPIYWRFQLKDGLE